MDHTDLARHDARARRAAAHLTIAAQVRQRIADGMRPLEALRQVCGEAAVDAMIGDIYAELRAAAGPADGASDHPADK